MASGIGILFALFRARLGLVGAQCSRLLQWLSLGLAETGEGVSVTPAKPPKQTSVLIAESLTQSRVFSGLVCRRWLSLTKCKAQPCCSSSRSPSGTAPSCGPGRRDAQLWVLSRSIPWEMAVIMPPRHLGVMPMKRDFLR